MCTLENPKDISLLNKSNNDTQIVCKIQISDLKQKHDEINIVYSELFEFYKKLTSKNESLKNIFNNLNLKVKLPLIL